MFPPEPSLRLITDMVAYTVDAIPKWNPINVCSYHLQEAGATPVQEIAYAMATAIAVLDAVRARTDVPRGRDAARLRAHLVLPERRHPLRRGGLQGPRDDASSGTSSAASATASTDAGARRFRYGVQVNSLGLTEAQPENNVIRIVLEALGVTLSKRARCRALQLPAWNEALGLPRPWDQQWSLRIQQILAYETDLLEFERPLRRLPRDRGAQRRAALREARAELEKVLAMGGAIAAVENAYMKQRLVESHTKRLQAIEAGEITVVGVNACTERERSPLTSGEQAILRVDAAAEHEQIERLLAFRARRSRSEVEAALRAPGRRA